MFNFTLLKTGVLALVLSLSVKGQTAQTDSGAYKNYEEKYTLETQAIDISTARNARQLGGYVCADGRKIKQNMLIRSGGLAWLDDADAKTLSEKYNVKYIVDFRTESELEANPDKKIDGAKSFNFSVFGEDLYGEKTKSKLGYYESLNGEDEDMALAKDRVITERYERILLSEYAQKAYAGFFDVLLDAKEGEAVLWHCSKGKDRAGIASALLLYALGADGNMADRDFEITNEAYKEDIDKAVAAAKKNGLNESDTTEYICASAGVDKKYLELAVKTAEKKYGSLHNYFNSQLGLSDAEIEELRDKFLEG